MRTRPLEIVIGGPTPFVININGEQRHSLHARERLQDIIERVRAGYAWMHRSFTNNLSGILFLLCFVGSPVTWFVGYMVDGDHERDVKQAAALMKISPTAEVTKQAVEEASKIPWKHTFYGLEYWGSSGNRVGDLGNFRALEACM